MKTKFVGVLCEPAHKIYNLKHFRALYTICERFKAALALILKPTRRLFPRSHTALVRQRRRSSDVTDSRGRGCTGAIKSSRCCGWKRGADPEPQPGKRQKGEKKKIQTELNQNMVKITFQSVSAQKPEKDQDVDKITLPQAHVSLRI